MLQVVEPDVALDLWSKEASDARWGPGHRHESHWLPYCQQLLSPTQSAAAYPAAMMTGDPIDEAPYEVRLLARSEASAVTVSPRITYGHHVTAGFNPASISTARCRAAPRHWQRPRQRLTGGTSSVATTSERALALLALPVAGARVPCSMTRACRQPSAAAGSG